MSPRWNWDSPTPSLASKCAPPPRSKGGVPIPMTGETLSTLPTLCRDISAEGCAAHPVGYNSQLQIVMAPWRTFFLNLNLLGL